MQDIDTSSPADILWANILISYSAIIRAQRIMYVADEKDHSALKSSESTGAAGSSTSWLVQTAWDRQANFMQAQARAQAELRALIKEFNAIADESDARRLKLEVMKKEVEFKQLEIDRMKNPAGSEQEDDGFMDALKSEVSKTWMDERDG